MTNNSFRGLCIGNTKFIGPHRLEAQRSCLVPRVEVPWCVPGQEQNFETNRKTALAQGFKPACIFPTLEAALTDIGDNIDFAQVNTPNFDHSTKAALLAAAGIPTGIDKPLADTLSNADAINQLYNKPSAGPGIPSLITPTYCFFSANLEARYRIRDSGLSSDLQGGTMTYNQDWLDRLLEEIGASEGQDQAAGRKNIAIGGEAGALGDILSHLLFLLYSNTGLKVVELRCRRRWVVSGRKETESDDEALVCAVMENGAVVDLKAAQYAGGHDNSMAWELWFKNGERFSWSIATHEALFWCPAKSRAVKTLMPSSFSSPVLGQTYSMPGEHAGDGWRKAEQRMLTSLLWRAYDCAPADAKPFHMGFEEGLLVQTWIDAALRSSKFNDGAGFGRISLTA